MIASRRMKIYCTVIRVAKACSCSNIGILQKCYEVATFTKQTTDIKFIVAAAIVHTQHFDC